MPHRKVSKYVPVGLFYASIAVIAAVVYINFPHKTWEYRSTPHVLDAKIKAGTILHWQVDVCRHSDKPFITERVIENETSGLLIELPEKARSSDIKKGQCAVVERQATIPDYTPPGKYHINFTTYTKVNHWNIVPVTGQSDSFEVINP